MQNNAALADWFVSSGLARRPQLAIDALTGGQSNPTFKVVTDCGAFVLRKRPDGLLLQSAHAIDREYRVMNALQDSGVPVPRMHAWCGDATLIGTDFFVMDFLDGRVLTDQTLPGFRPAQRQEIYSEMNRVIAALHGVDPSKVGLADYGRRSGNYVARQIDRWTRQSREATLPLPSAMSQLMDWLPQHVPDARETTLVHGDYRLDNLVFHPTQPRVVGVLDWELSTLGDPVADFAYHCMSWHIPPQTWRGIAGLDLDALGIPAERRYVQAYERATNRDVTAHWDFYMAYNLFRMSAILHGIAQRAHLGTASAEDAVATGAKAAALAALGWRSALRHQAANR